MSEKVLPPGMNRHKCPGCKGPHTSYYNYPTLCDGAKCYDERKARGYKAK